MRRVFWLSACLITACPAPGPSGGFCATESQEGYDGAQLAVCEVAFAEAPLVRPPDDSESGGVRKVYGGFGRDESLQLSFIGRGFKASVAGAAFVTAELTSNRYAYYLYVADVRGGTVESVKPVARIDDRVFGRLLTNKVLEGMASPRSSDGGETRYEITMQNVPMRIHLDAQLAATESDRDTKFPRYALGGSVENAAGGVRGSDGGCFTSLALLGGKNPLYGATGSGDRVTILRHPNMHGAADDVFTLTWPAGVPGGANMGGGMFISVPELIQATIPAPTEAHNSPHGVPWGSPSADLKVVSGGGAVCP